MNCSAERGGYMKFSMRVLTKDTEIDCVNNELVYWVNEMSEWVCVNEKRNIYVLYYLYLRLCLLAFLLLRHFRKEVKYFRLLEGNMMSSFVVAK